MDLNRIYRLIEGGFDNEAQKLLIDFLLEIHKEGKMLSKQDSEEAKCINKLISETLFYSEKNGFKSITKDFLILIKKLHF